MADNDILTRDDAIRLGELLTACQEGKRARWLVRYQDGDLVPDSNPVEGTLRSVVGDEHGRALLSNVQDVRDGFIWISATFELFYPVRKVLLWMQEQTFSIN